MANEEIHRARLLGPVLPSKPDGPIAQRIPPPGLKCKRPPGFPRGRSSDFIPIFAGMREAWPCGRVYGPRSFRLSGHGSRA